MYGKTNIEKDTQKIKLNNKENFTFTTKFEYFSNYFTPKLRENFDI